MLADEVYGALRNYIDQTLIGMGAIKGASAQLSNVYDPDAGTNTMTWTWEDNTGVEHTTTMVVYDGPQGDIGPKGDNGDTGESGFSPTIEVKTSTADEYILTITNEEGSYDTPNLKGGGGGATDLADLTDVAVALMETGDVLQYDAITQKWINAEIATMTGATALLDGTKGLVPAPEAGDNEKLLCGNGSFTDKVLTDAQYAALQALFT